MPNQVKTQEDLPKTQNNKYNQLYTTFGSKKLLIIHFYIKYILLPTLEEKLNEIKEL